MSIATSEPTFFLFAARVFDGTTKLTTSLSPATGLSPRYTVDQATLGRLSYRDLLRPGSHGAFISMRLVGPPTAAGLVRVRSISEEENTGKPELRRYDVMLEERPLTSRWSPAFLVGPTDALAPTWNPDEGGAIEVMRVDAQAGATFAFIQAAYPPSPPDHDPSEVTTITVDEDTTLDAWHGTLYVLVTGPAQITLPGVDEMSPGARLMIHLVSGGVSRYKPTTGDALNSRVDGSVLLRPFVTDVVELADDGWLSTGSPHYTDLRTNATVGATVVIAPPAGRVTTVEVDFTEPGILQLPSYVSLGYDTELRITRKKTGGTEQVQVKPAVGEAINGASDGSVYLGHNDVLRVTPGTFSGGAQWVAVSESLGKDQVQIHAAGNVTIKPWGKRRKVVRLTEGAAQQVTLPLLANVPDGAEVVVSSEGAAGTIARGGAPDVIIGLAASENTVAVPSNTTRRVVAAGNVWLVS